MTESKKTMWHIGNPSEYGTFNACMVFDENEKSIALVYGIASNVKLEDMGERDAEGLKNARLIAVSPQLLRALEIIEDYSSNLDDVNPESYLELLSSINITANFAIRKAKP